MRAIENCLKSVLGKPERDGKSPGGMSAKADYKAVEGNHELLEKCFGKAEK